MSESKHSTEEDHVYAIQDRLSPRALPSGHTLNLGREESKDKDRVDEASGVQEDEVLVVFELPDNSQSEARFRLGQTVQVLKSFVEAEFGIPMQTCVLRFLGKVMLDPLSLLDYPETQGNIAIHLLLSSFCNLPLSL